MIRILSLQHTRKTSEVINSELVISIGSMTHRISFEFPGTCLPPARDVDFALPTLIVLGSITARSLDLNAFGISSEAVEYCDKILSFYIDSFPESNFSHVSIENYTLNQDASQAADTNSPQVTTSDARNHHRHGTGLFFSGGVDSLYTFYANKDDVDALIPVLGLDIHPDDKELRDEVVRRFSTFAQYFQKKLLLVHTTIRLTTEQYIHRDLMYGPCLGTIGILLAQANPSLHRILISSRVSTMDHKAGSDPQLDRWLSLGHYQMDHFGEGVSRTAKITLITQHPTREHVLRVCRENTGQRYNCGICEKCIRTLLEMKHLGVLDKAISFANTDLSESHIKKITFSRGNIAYYRNIVSHLSHDPDMAQTHALLQKKVSEYDTANITTLLPRSKKKNILFIDFNGVLSFNTFWHSYKEMRPDAFATIQQKLFTEHLDLVKSWMKGDTSSEAVCDYLAPLVAIPAPELLATLETDCRSIDISAQSISLLHTLKPYYHIVLVTDNMDCFTRRTVPHNTLLTVFDLIWASSEHGTFKKENNGLIFTQLIERFEAQTENCILLDDSKNNTKTFTELGGLSYCKNTEQDVVATLEDIYHRTQSKWLRQF